jgi:hypothetical protein
MRCSSAGYLIGLAVPISQGLESYDDCHILCGAIESWWSLNPSANLAVLWLMDAMEMPAVDVFGSQQVKIFPELHLANMPGIPNFLLSAPQWSKVCTYVMKRQIPSE